MEDQAAPSPGDAPHPLIGWTLCESCRGGQRCDCCFRIMQPGGGQGLECTLGAGDTCHSSAQSLEFVCAAAAPRLSTEVCCDRTGTVCGGEVPPQLSVRLKPPSQLIMRWKPPLTLLHQRTKTQINLPKLCLCLCACMHARTQAHRHTDYRHNYAHRFSLMVSITVNIFFPSTDQVGNTDCHTYSLSQDLPTVACSQPPQADLGSDSQSLFDEVKPELPEVLLSPATEHESTHTHTHTHNYPVIVMTYVCY